jgi:predicted nucleic acid-binding protein
MAVVLDSGAVTRLAERSRWALAMIAALREQDLWPPLVPSVVLVECLTGADPRDAAQHRFVRTCEVVDGVPMSVARRAAWLRTQARTGPAVDAVVAATAEPGGAVLTGDVADLRALAGYTVGVTVERV